MPPTDLAAPLWFTSFSGEPRAVRSRDELLTLETAPVQWEDADICAPLEIVLPLWEKKRAIRSDALVRPLGHCEMPWIALGSHKDNGPESWERVDELPRQRRLKRVCPALLRRRLWGRVLWLDRELNWLADAQGEISEERLWRHRGILRLYMGANGEAEWFQPNTPRHSSLWVDFSWGTANETARLLGSSDEELRAHIVELTQNGESDAGFSLRWILLDWGTESWRTRSLLRLRTRRDSIEQMRDFLVLALQCEPNLRDLGHLTWNVAPLENATDFYGDPTSWREPLEAVVPIPQENLHLTYQSGHFRLPPLLRRLREWAGVWFEAALDEELSARHRCVEHPFADPTISVERASDLSAHEQIEAFVRLRDFLAPRVTPDELAALLRSD